MRELAPIAFRFRSWPNDSDICVEGCTLNYEKADNLHDVALLRPAFGWRERRRTVEALLLRFILCNSLTVARSVVSDLTGLVSDLSYFPMDFAKEVFVCVGFHNQQSTPSLAAMRR